MLYYHKEPFNVVLKCDQRAVAQKVQSAPANKREVKIEFPMAPWNNDTSIQEFFEMILVPEESTPFSSVSAYSQLQPSIETAEILNLSNVGALRKLKAELLEGIFGKEVAWRIQKVFKTGK